MSGCEQPLGLSPLERSYTALGPVPPFPSSDTLSFKDCGNHTITGMKVRETIPVNVRLSLGFWLWGVAWSPSYGPHLSGWFSDKP